MIRYIGHGNGLLGGAVDFEAEAARRLRRNGCLVTEGPQERSWNHHVIGVGIGHDDARFAETGASMAAYVENEASIRWWDADSSSRKHYEP